jgi:hypothetical protein
MDSFGEAHEKPVWFHVGGCYETLFRVMNDGSISIRVNAGTFGVIGQQTGIGVRLVPESIPSLIQFLEKHCKKEETCHTS